MGCGPTTLEPGAGLIDLLVLFAGIALLFTRATRAGSSTSCSASTGGSRVVAYAALMTDAYPPFRLDQGGEETGVRGADGSANPS